MEHIVTIPRYDMPAYPRFDLAGTPVHTLKIVDFLRYIIRRDNLGISEYLEVMGQNPFFLIAATGLGKTVAVPVHLLVRLMQHIGQSPSPQPHVWIVEPRIPIALDQMQFMNTLWQEYLRYKKERKLPPLFGCATSSSGTINKDAPIQFITTGVFELLAKGGQLAPANDRVVIDEAHVTIEQNPGIELGVALARQAGITVDFMSATVDTATLAEDLSVQIIRADKQRYPIWKANLWQPLDKILSDLVEGTLVSPDPTSDFFPQPSEFPSAAEITAAVTEPGRSHGMLAIVNSFAGEQSDIARLADTLRQKFPSLPVLELASEVIRDARREQAFREQLELINKANQNYVILATSVVEMGITFPTLDFVVTMDCGYDQETIGNQTFPVVAPLGVNALLQRIGRVGRRRPGIAYISYEVGADYAELEDDELNRPGTLQYEPIRFPMESAPLLPLAYYTCGQEWDTVAEWVASLDLPSKLHENTARMAYLQTQLELLKQLGITDENDWLTPFGERMGQWVGRTDLAYAVKLQQEFETGCSLPELLFWVVAAALSETPLGTFRVQHDYFVDYTGGHAEIEHRVELWEDHWHEDLALYAMFAWMAASSPGSILGNAPDDDLEWSVVYKSCNNLGIDSAKLQKAGAAVAELWRLFCRINRKSDRFKEPFGGSQPHAAELPWEQLTPALEQSVYEKLFTMAGSVTVELSMDEAFVWHWYEPRSRISGVISQDDTPIHLRLKTVQYVARPIPSRKAKGEDATWRLAHLGGAAKTRR